MKRLALAAAAGALAFPSAAAGAGLRLIVPLKADDAGLRSFATAASTPGSPLYGRYEPVATLARRFGAAKPTQAAVVRYLRHAGATQVQTSPTGMFVQATMPATSAERAFGVRLQAIRAGGGERFLRPRAAPTRLPAGALGVVGLDTRPLLRALDTGPPLSGYLPVSGTPQGCQGALATGGFTPNQYLAAYGYDPLHAAGLNGRGQRIALIEIDGFKLSDLASFARCFSLHVPAIRIFGVGVSRPLPPGPEATLDLEMLDTAAPRASSFEVFESRSDAVAVDQAFAAPLLTPGAKPQVVTASIGLCEPVLAEAFGAAGVLSVERNLELAAATGITMVVASGDTGSADCSDAQGNVVDALAVDYPSGSPWVTSVGGINVRLDPANQIVSQQVWNDTGVQLAAGGGGLSQLFARPPYQNGVVAANARSVPDLAMLADVAPGYAVFCTAPQSGCHGWRSVGGTSAAAPLVAGGIGIVDQDLERHRREDVGLANPLLYAIGRAAAGPSVFGDVTQGSNDVGPYIPGGDGRPLGCCSAGPGFDDASGWGSVDLARLDRRALTMLPRSAFASVSIPAGQQPVKAGRLLVRLTSTKGTAYAFGFASIAGGATLDLRSARYRFGRPGSKLVAIRFSRSQERRLAAAVAAHRRVGFELFGAALDAAGAVGNVSPGRDLVII